MTYKEILQQEHPEEIDEINENGRYNCPCYYGYEYRYQPCPKDKNGKFMTCQECWDREATEYVPKMHKVSKNVIDYKAELLQLMKMYSDLPVIAMVDCDVVGGEMMGRWAGSIGECRVDNVYSGEEKIHFSTEDDWYDVLLDMKGCKRGYTTDGRDIDDLTDKEGEEIYANLPWFEAIVVNIDTSKVE